MLLRSLTPDKEPENQQSGNEGSHQQPRTESWLTTHRGETGETINPTKGGTQCVAITENLKPTTDIRFALSERLYPGDMSALRQQLRDLDDRVVEIMGRIGLPFLRVGIGLIFIWFGVLKPLGLSPAAELLAKTVYWWTPEIVVPALGWWEVAIGVTFLIPQLTRVAIFLLAVQMPGTFLPLVLLPEVCFTVFPWGLTLEGQYIVKNLVIIGAALVIGSTVETRRRLRTQAIPVVSA